MSLLYISWEPQRETRHYQAKFHEAYYKLKATDRSTINSRVLKHSPLSAKILLILDELLHVLNSPLLVSDLKRHCKRKVAQANIVDRDILLSLTFRKLFVKGL